MSALGSVSGAPAFTINSSEEEQHLLDTPLRPLDAKVDACKEALFAGTIGALAGAGSSFLLAGYAVANTGSSAYYLGTLAIGIASGVGAIAGSITKSVLTSTAIANTAADRPLRAFLGGSGTSALSLTFFNAMLTTSQNTAPLWLQFAVGIGTGVVAGLGCAFPKNKTGAGATGAVVSIGTGTLTGYCLGTGLGMVCPSIGPANGAFFGLAGLQAVVGYISTIRNKND